MITQPSTSEAQSRLGAQFWWEGPFSWWYDRSMSMIVKELIIILKSWTGVPPGISPNPIHCVISVIRCNKPCDQVLGREGCCFKGWPCLPCWGHLVSQCTSRHSHNPVDRPALHIIPSLRMNWIKYPDSLSILMRYTTELSLSAYLLIPWIQGSLLHRIDHRAEWWVWMCRSWCFILSKLKILFSKLTAVTSRVDHSLSWRNHSVNN